MKWTKPLILQIKIFVSFSIFFFVTLIGMVYFSGYSIKTSNEQLEESFQKTTYKTAESINKILDTYELTSKLISDNLIIAKELEQYKNLSPSH